ncbi:FAD/NAD(P)-binding protein [Streptomyces sp. NPDC051554]|uniref:FAD/NAD(P)-binding protein n=1 Tax=Streptomyces sp. NPDC051554 TaxID=3365656 RepID=UPI0037B87E76
MSTTTVVIGAAPCGLSTVARLKAFGLHVRVCGSPMARWAANMPEGVLLKPPPSASVLSAPKSGFTLDAYARQAGERQLEGHDPVPVEMFVRYRRWFAEQLVPEVENIRALGVDRQADGFYLTLAPGQELRTSAVVVASGMDGFAYVPEPLAALVPEGRGDARQRSWSPRTERNWSLS